MCSCLMNLNPSPPRRRNFRQEEGSKRRAWPQHTFSASWDNPEKRAQATSSHKKASCMFFFCKQTRRKFASAPPLWAQAAAVEAANAMSSAHHNCVRVCNHGCLERTQCFLGPAQLTNTLLRKSNSRTRHARAHRSSLTLQDLFLSSCASSESCVSFITWRSNSASATARRASRATTADVGAEVSTGLRTWRERHGHHVSD